MAERKAKRRCGTELIELKAAIDCVTDLTVVQVDEQKLGPDAARLFLQCKIYALKKA